MRCNAPQNRWFWIKNFRKSIKTYMRCCSLWLPLRFLWWNCLLLVMMYWFVENRHFPNSTRKWFFWPKWKFCCNIICCRFKALVTKFMWWEVGWVILGLVEGVDVFQIDTSKFSIWKLRFLRKTAFNSCGKQLHI